MDRAARLLRGTLRVRVESAFPEPGAQPLRRARHRLFRPPMGERERAVLHHPRRRAKKARTAPRAARRRADRRARGGRALFPAPLSPPLHAARRAGAHARAVLCQFLLHLGFRGQRQRDRSGGKDPARAGKARAAPRQLRLLLPPAGHLQPRPAGAARAWRG